MPYGKRVDPNHVTRVPFMRLDSTGEISSESSDIDTMIDHSSRKSGNNKQSFNSKGVDLRNMFNRKYTNLGGYRNNLTAEDSHNSCKILKDIVNKTIIDDSKPIMTESRGKSYYRILNDVKTNNIESVSNATSSPDTERVQSNPKRCDEENVNRKMAAKTLSENPKERKKAAIGTTKKDSEDSCEIPDNNGEVVNSWLDLCTDDECDELKKRVVPDSSNYEVVEAHFPEDAKIAKVHHMITWAHAYQAARKGQWRENALDHERFQRRIDDTESSYSSIINRT
ncbi:unnamed protein product [Mytilus edulis]|uniref:Protein phosphatase 1 regulatory subunit 15A/B C-terminal domain-containing protein n=1 Tax=Mytilus edulis TaxID=6550 RepID=A0A8S3QFN3_MYTED|nr:unnamed protein product [Mytilus edulis]